MIDVNDAYTISGTVDSFEDDGVGDWTVELNQARCTLRNQCPSATGTGIVEGHVNKPTRQTSTVDDRLVEDGEANSSAIRSRPTPVWTTTEYPTGVAGEFDGHFDDGHVIGAFGAPQGGGSDAVPQ